MLRIPFLQEASEGRINRSSSAEVKRNLKDNLEKWKRGEQTSEPSEAVFTESVF